MVIKNFKENANFLKFDEFVSSLKPNEKVSIFSHCDLDGLTSAALTSILIKKKTDSFPDLAYLLSYNAFSVLHKNFKPQSKKIMITDISVDSFLDTFCYLENNVSSVCVIDHHSIVKNLNSKKTCFIKPQMVSDIPPHMYCAAKFSFDLYSRHIDLSDKEWIAFLGIIGDSGFDFWEKYIRKRCDELKISVDDLLSAADLIEAILVVDSDKKNNLLDILISASSPKDLFVPDLLISKKSFDKELTKLIDDFNLSADYHSDLDLYIYTFESKFANIKSSVINRVSQNHPKSTIIFLHKAGSKYKISARNQSGNIAVNTLLEKVCSKIENAQGGGHIPAAGGFFPYSKLEDFKLYLFDELEKLKK